MKKEFEQTDVSGSFYYHGSQNLNIDFSNESPLYLTTDYNLAIKFATREFYGESLLESENPCVYHIHFLNNNFLKLSTEDDYENFFQDTSDWKYIQKMGFNGMLYKNYVCVFPKVEKKILKQEILHSH